MTEATLKLTQKQLESLVNNKLDTERFKETFNDIPMYHPDHVMEKGETHYQYQEDDGRQYRWFIFIDTLTGIEYCLNYTYNSEWPNDIMETPESIQIVTNDEDSSIYEKPVVVPTPEKALSPEQQADEELWARYQAMKHECKTVVPKEKILVPKAHIDEILNFLKSQIFSIYQLRSVVIPVCIEYKIEDASFWKWIQVKRKVWKA